MGGRGAFANISERDFRFKEAGQQYHSIGNVDGVKVLLKDSGSVKAPEISHSPNRIYATVQNGQLKHLTWYDENHNQSVSIDFLHPHNGVQPHKHYNLNHDDGGIPITEEELKLANKIKRRYSLL